MKSPKVFYIFIMVLLLSSAKSMEDQSALNEEENSLKQPDNLGKNSDSSTEQAQILEATSSSQPLEIRFNEKAKSTPAMPDKVTKILSSYKKAQEVLKLKEDSKVSSPLANTTSTSKENKPSKQEATKPTAASEGFPEKANKKQTPTVQAEKDVKENSDENFKVLSGKLPDFLGENFENDFKSIKDYSEQITNQRKQNERSSSQNKDLEEKNQIMIKTNSNLKEEQLNLEIKKSILETRREDTMKNIEAFSQFNEGMSDLVGFAKRVLEKLVNIESGNDGKNNQINQEIESLKKEIGELKSEKDKIDELVMEESKKLNQAEIIARKYDLKSQDLDSKIKKLKEIHDKTIEDLGQLEKQNEKLVYEVVNKDSNRRELVKEMENKKNTLTHLNLNTEFLKKMLENTKNDHTLMIDTKKEIESKIENLDFELEKEHNDFELKKTKKLNELEDLKAKARTDRETLVRDIDAERELEKRQNERIERLKLIESKLSNNQPL
jgi:hypothetical protein